MEDDPWESGFYSRGLFPIKASFSCNGGSFYNISIHHN